MASQLDKLWHVEQLAIILHSDAKLQWNTYNPKQHMAKDKLVAKEQELFGDDNILFGESSTIYGEQATWFGMKCCSAAWVHHVLLCFFCLEPSRPWSTVFFTRLFLIEQCTWESAEPWQAQRTMGH